MMTTNDGGPAFPYEANSETLHWDKGMTLRDYFAAAAMQGLLASHPEMINDRYSAAESAYQQADAMLAERAK